MSELTLLTMANEQRAKLIAKCLGFDEDKPETWDMSLISIVLRYAGEAAELRAAEEIRTILAARGKRVA